VSCTTSPVALPRHNVPSQRHVVFTFVPNANTTLNTTIHSPALAASIAKHLSASIASWQQPCHRTPSPAACPQNSANIAHVYNHDKLQHRSRNTYIAGHPTVVLVRVALPAHQVHVLALGTPTNTNVTHTGTILHTHPGKRTLASFFRPRMQSTMYS
jgi:hypothetical protein